MACKPGMISSYTGLGDIFDLGRLGWGAFVASLGWARAAATPPTCPKELHTTDRSPAPSQPTKNSVQVGPPWKRKWLT